MEVLLLKRIKLHAFGAAVRTSGRGGFGVFNLLGGQEDLGFLITVRTKVGRIEAFDLGARFEEAVDHVDLLDDDLWAALVMEPSRGRELLDEADPLTDATGIQECDVVEVKRDHWLREVFQRFEVGVLVDRAGEVDDQFIVDQLLVYF